MSRATLTAPEKPFDRYEKKRALNRIRWNVKSAERARGELAVRIAQAELGGVPLPAIAEAAGLRIGEVEELLPVGKDALLARQQAAPPPG